MAARIGDTPIDLTATFGAPGLLLEPAKPAGPFPLDVKLQAADAVVTLKGQIAQPAALSGASLHVVAQIPDLAALSSVARHPLPPLKAVSLQGNVTDAAGGFGRRLTVTWPARPRSGSAANRH
jgi:hypothetical protein